MSEQFDPNLPAPMLVVPGIVIRTKVNLGQQDCEMGFEASVDRDAPQGEIDAVCDRMMDAARRWRAKILLPDYKRGRENIAYKHNENRKRLAELEARLGESQRIRQEEIDKLLVQRDRLLSTAAQEWRDSGKRGEFKPQPQTTRQYDGKIEELRKAGDAELGQANVQREQLDVELRDGERALAQWDAMIAEQEALLRAE